MKYSTISKLLFEDESDTEVPAGDSSGLPKYEYVISNASKIAGEDGFLDQLEKVLKKFDIRMYDLPSTLNTDTYGYIFSKDQLSDAQIGKIDGQISGGEVGIPSEEPFVTGDKPDTEIETATAEDEEDFKIT